jgi:hypothetical protein
MFKILHLTAYIFVHTSTSACNIIHYRYMQSLILSSLNIQNNINSSHSLSHTHCSTD